jgi:hypothetical protein
MEIAQLLNRPYAARPAACPIPRGMVNLRPMGDTDQEPLDEPDPSRSAPYTLLDDLSIFKVVAAYYGFDFRGKIPWSFWQTYRRVANSNRSNSSLYHHWNGAMRKKYDHFLSGGRMCDCIAWLETAAAASQAATAHHAMPTGAPLCHMRSEPPVRLGVPATGAAEPPARPLVRSASHASEPCYPLARFPRPLAD